MYTNGGGCGKSHIDQVVVGSVWKARRPCVDGSFKTLAVESVRGSSVTLRNMKTDERVNRLKQGLVAGYSYCGLLAKREGADDVVMVAMLVSPDVASGWLERYSPPKYNRDLDHGRVDEFVEEMLGDRFKCTPQPIIFTADSKLSDGQHRLWAIVKSNRSAWIRIAHHKNSAVAKEIVAGDPPAHICRDDVGGPLDLVKPRPAYVINGLNSDRNFGYEKRVQAIVHAIDAFRGDKRTRVSPGHVDAVVSSFRGGIEWSAVAIQHSIPVVGAAALAIAYQKKSTRKKVEEIASIISTKAWHNDPTKGVAANTLEEMKKGKSRRPEARRAAILRILRCIAAFCEGKKIERINVKHFNEDYFLKAA